MACRPTTAGWPCRCSTCQADGEPGTWWRATQGCLAQHPASRLSTPQCLNLLSYLRTPRQMLPAPVGLSASAAKPRPKPLRAAGWTEFLATLNVTQKGAAMAPRFSSTQHPTSDTRVDPLPLGGVHLLMSQTVRSGFTEAFLIQESSTTLWNEPNPNSFHLPQRRNRSVHLL